MRKFNVRLKTHGSQVSLTYDIKINKQPMSCEAQLTETQIEGKDRRNTREMSGSPCRITSLLRAAVMIYATVVNTRTHTNSF